ncbi:hypothetical protein [Desulfovibrio piger]|mgnify:FL=1|uniref:hypothetical protein n=1 Tax=Desulfovibrio piger TaxID=901 RepID=UPI0026EB6D8C|nr:hypothetical protein [Desulfovibrio piger]
MNGDLKAMIAGGVLMALLLVAGFNAWVESKVDAEVSLRAHKALTTQQEQTVSSLAQHTKDLEEVYRVHMDLEKRLEECRALSGDELYDCYLWVLSSGAAASGDNATEGAAGAVR